ncbi:uncharacterized protein LOC122504630 [Leptopilina heterotoma]|uniref:uncharacterized protein LOC122504630 n=1 Tax=Leptopilina heterotoma TaxID=63436 RepID=UPI001CA8E52F|nr:uncharacterized protein LOC122504630 [Leptopilina heterotoma]
MLIGSGTSLSLFSIGSINLSENGNDLYLQKTRLGWIIGGGLDISTKSRTSVDPKCMLSDLKNLIETFWFVEEISNTSFLSVEEEECETHFKKHVTRNEIGQYIVALPFKNNIKFTGESKQHALKSLTSLQKKFRIDNEFKLKYEAVMQEYLDLKHMTPLTSKIDHDGFYLPHHAVFKDTSNTTKFRVVFNPSAVTSSGISLNETLMVGPTIQDDLFCLLIRFRLYKFVLLGDIEKMYRQFLIREEDRKYQKVLWLENDEIKEFQLNRVTFGFAPASFLAIRCVHQLIEDEGTNFPLASRILKKDLYIDNLITGTFTVQEALEVYITNILDLAKLNMRQWASNSMDILDGIDKKNLDNELNLNNDSVLKTLGMYWKAKEDAFIYRVKIDLTTNKITKRFILSEIAKLFDPLGLLGPIIFYAKLIMQELWQLKVTWDESVPSSIHYNWTEFYNQLNSLKNIKFPRQILIDDFKTIELHGFSDASEKGYGACLYIRSENDEGKCQCSLLCSKSRVAPLKKLTIPKLELCGALLLTNLYTKVIKSIPINIKSTTFWTDSEIVLHWLHSNSNSLKTFVANRVSEIQSKTKINQWYHIRSKNNPADKLSRGLLPEKLVTDNLWFNGPDCSCESLLRLLKGRPEDSASSAACNMGG